MYKFESALTAIIVIFLGQSSLCQPTQCAADALQAIADQGGLEINSSYEWMANGDDHIQLATGTDGNLNTDLFINNILSVTGNELLTTGDHVRIEAVSIGFDDGASFATSFGYSCPDWGLGITNDLAIVQTNPPTLCAAEALQNITDQGGLEINSSYEWMASGDDHIILLSGTDGILNTELFLNGTLSSPGNELLIAGDLIRIDAITIGLDDGASFAGSFGYSCQDWGLGVDDDLAVVSTLPVTWSKPTKVEIMDSKSRMTFSTAQQINNSHFEIEHSVDGRQYAHLGTIEGEGNTTTEIDYEYIHKNPRQGINYYRVKQVDYDGQYSYSNVASVVYTVEQITVYPNPVEDQLTVTTPSIGAALLFNYLGQQVRSYILAEGDNVIDVSAMDSGLYLLKLSDGSVERVVKR